MFPLYDENPTRITPYFTYGLIGMNVVVFLHEVSLSNTQLDQFFQLYAVVPEQLTTNWSGEWTTLFTSQFLHGGWWHLISNMIYLWVFGNNIEDRLGHLKYLFFYLTCGALAALCQWFIGINSIIPSLGASGAISGVLGAYLMVILSIFLINSYELIIFKNITFLNLLIISLLISSISQIGDLIISFFKRKAKIKDTGKLIPGHGGILDRIDGMVFAFPFSLIFFILF